VCRNNKMISKLLLVRIDIASSRLIKASPCGGSTPRQLSSASSSCPIISSSSVGIWIPETHVASIFISNISLCVKKRGVSNARPAVDAG
jgi:hypothetical protein